MPPISAWLELEGSPTNQVMRFHVIAPTSPASTMFERDRVLVDDPLRDRRRDRDRDERAGEVEHGRARDRRARAQRTRRDARRDRVGGVVEAVGEVEEQRDRDDGPEHEHPSSASYAFLTTMFAIVFAAVSQQSSARSSRVVDVLPADHHQRVDPIVAEEGCEPFAVDAVALVLEPLELDERLLDPREALEVVAGDRELLGRRRR